MPVTGFSEFVPNPLYSGPVKPRLARFEEVPFTTTTAEVDALRAGTIDFGYLPLNDLATKAELERLGYRLVAWPQYGWTGILLQYSNGVAGRILAQLPVRQAMEHLVNMGRVLKVVLHGYGHYFSGPVPTNGPFANAADRHDPYPYSVSAARSVLRSHGWTVRPNGESTCSRPGSGPAE
ncbi:extracellular solute-binding protein family 5, partial [mine drainage metagenome]